MHAQRQCIPFSLTKIKRKYLCVLEFTFNHQQELSEWRIGGKRFQTLVIVQTSNQTVVKLWTPDFLTLHKRTKHVTYRVND